MPECPPRFATPRNPERESLGREVAATMRLLRVEPMPWQDQVLETGMEVLPDGRMAYREVVVTVPRQCGKTLMLLALIVHRLGMWDREAIWGQYGGSELRTPAQQVAYCAQGVTEAVNKWARDLWPILEGSGLVPRIGMRLRRSVGDGGIDCRNGAGLRILTKAATSGHGTTLHLAVVDEAMAYTDESREQALMPAMRTVRDAQVWIVSTAGDATSEYLRRKVLAGRERETARLRGDPVESRSAYFEWGVPEAADWNDRRLWAASVPALGHTIDMDTLEHDFDTMDVDEFRRSTLNQWLIGAVQAVFDWEDWERAGDINAGPPPDLPLVLAVDAPPERDRAVIVAAGGGQLEVVKEAEGTDWITGDLRKMTASHKPVAIAGMKTGPLSGKLEELENEGLPIVAYSWSELATACGEFYDAVVGGRLAIRPDDSLDQAVIDGTKKDRGGAWVWWRRNQHHNLHPLIAATLAYYEADRQHRATPEPLPSITTPVASITEADEDMADRIRKWEQVWADAAETTEGR